MLESTCDTAQSSVAEAVKVLGKLLIQSKGDYADPSDQQALGWLMVALGEISLGVQNTHDAVRENLAGGVDSERSVGGNCTRVKPRFGGVRIKELVKPRKCMNLDK